MHKYQLNIKNLKYHNIVIVICHNKYKSTNCKALHSNIQKESFAQHTKRKLYILMYYKKPLLRFPGAFLGFGTTLLLEPEARSTAGELEPRPTGEPEPSPKAPEPLPTPRTEPSNPEPLPTPRTKPSLPAMKRNEKQNTLREKKRNRNRKDASRTQRRRQRRIERRRRSCFVRRNEKRRRSRE